MLVGYFEGKCSKKILKYFGKNYENSYVYDIVGKNRYYWKNKVFKMLYLCIFSVNYVC